MASKEGVSTDSGWTPLSFDLTAQSNSFVHQSQQRTVDVSDATDPSALPLEASPFRAVDQNTELSVDGGPTHKPEAHSTEAGKQYTPPSVWRRASRRASAVAHMRNNVQLGSRRGYLVAGEAVPIGVHLNVRRVFNVRTVEQTFDAHLVLQFLYPASPIENPPTDEEDDGEFTARQLIGDCIIFFRYTTF